MLYNKFSDSHFRNRIVSQTLGFYIFGIMFIIMSIASADFILDLNLTFIQFVSIFISFVFFIGGTLCIFTPIYENDIKEECDDIRSLIWQIKYSYNKVLFMENPYFNGSKQELEEEWNKIHKNDN